MTQAQQKPLLIKLGGAVLENKQALTNLFSALTEYLATQQRPLLLVHGGGVIVEDVTVLVDFNKRGSTMAMGPLNHGS